MRPVVHMISKASPCSLIRSGRSGLPSPLFGSPRVERCKAGLSRARAQGKRLGRPSLPPPASAVRRLLASGTGIVKTAKIAGVGVSVAQRIKAAI
jgi:hypothetical protein